MTDLVAVGRRAADLPAQAGLTPRAVDITAHEAEEVLRAAVDVADGLDAPTVGEFLTGFAPLPPSASGKLEKSAQRGRLAQQH
ncbi:hypothetical protein ETD86_19935 [Nonomuraea turkmeniaca]|uniref:AMP-binding enzyme C-terminal domain-containing protein n=1 Tax=Nonomuraea turkmeniaca TaxID=103838 RepID=A0A5S4FHK5_9ACTN|nr:hypothetical protein [Nonomuraea turkmeniaca]TMR19431.1 hypothetical protein ETD86_19935 [Nonomuraea turkmeniaca]